MEKLKELLQELKLGDEDIKRVIESIPKNDDDNLGIRYDKLKSKKQEVESELEKANQLIESLKANNQSADDVKNQINDYKAQIDEMKKENEKIRTENALRLALTKSGALDVDYMMYKLSNQSFKLDNDGKIEHIESIISDAKKDYANQFKGEDTSREKVITNPLGGGSNEPKKMSKEDIFKISDKAERIKAIKENLLED